MSFSNINVVNNGSQSRVLFDGFNRTNDRNPNSGKVGVRSHHWFTAFFLRIFGKIVDIKTTDGKSICLNKNSFNKWRARHRSAMTLTPHSPLPSAKEIIAHRKGLAKKQEEAAKLKNQNKAATTIQKHVRAFVAKSKFNKTKKAALTIQSHFRGHLVKKELGNLIAIKKEIDLLKDHIEKAKGDKEATAKDHDETINATKEAKEALESKKQSLESEIRKLRQELRAKEQEKLAEEESNSENGPERSNSDNAFLKFFKKLGKKTKTDNLKAATVTQSEPISLSKLSLEQEIQILNSEIANKNEVVRVFKVQIGDFEDQIENIFPLEKEMDLQKIQDTIDAKEKDLVEKNKAYDEQIIKMNNIGKALPLPSAVAPEQKEETEIPLTKMITPPQKTMVHDRSIPVSNPMEDVSTESTVQEEQIVTVNHIENLFKDVESHAHKELKTLMEAMLGKFSKEIVKTWEFDPQTGKFTLILDNPGKLWVLPVFDNGKPDPKTPNGVVLLMGDNNQKEIKGQLDSASNKITFSKGFETYCKYKTKIGPFNKEGIADGTIQSIQFSPKSQKVTIVAHGKDRKLGIGSKETDVKKLSTVLETWNAGTIPTVNHEKFLAAK